VAHRRAFTLAPPDPPPRRQIPTAHRCPLLPQTLCPSVLSAPLTHFCLNPLLPCLLPFRHTQCPSPLPSPLSKDAAVLSPLSQSAPVLSVVHGALLAVPLSDYHPPSWYPFPSAHACTHVPPTIVTSSCGSTELWACTTVADPHPRSALLGKCGIHPTFIATVVGVHCITCCGPGCQVMHMRCGACVLM
jgi:hypothetical protein